MNKKFICLIVVLLVTVLCLAACVQDDTERLTEINLLLRSDYSIVQVNVHTDRDGVELESEYKYTKQSDGIKVEYKYEILNSFNINNGVITAPSELKSVCEGTALVKDGVIVEHNGAQVSNGDLMQYDTVSLVLRPSYFRNTSSNTHRFQASVVSGKEKDLFGEDFDGQDVSITILYTDSRLVSMEIDYTVDAANVKIEYSFTK